MEKNKDKILKFIFLVYLIGVITFTFVLRETMTIRLPDNRGVSLEPFREFGPFIHHTNHFSWFLQIFLNILMFVPFGFLLPQLYYKFKSLFITLFFGFLFSSFIELMQYITGRGLTDIDDVINNTTGALCGFILYSIVTRIYNRIDNNYY